ncbi:MAG: carboxypeptidase regulatory-like domain-containing protein [Dehalococcoidales bacterium]|nr:carboxypeptidase regulatory-like domain-containing protein [Dehalococcoidales bacterium]
MKAIVFNVLQCVGCYSCQIGCKDEHCGNDWMPYARPQPETGQFWMKLREFERGATPQVKVSYTPVPCMHCDDAPCMEACLTEGAIIKRADGLVIIDPIKCSGCQLCITACPYGAIFYNSGLQIAQKCTGCAHLIDRGWPIKEPRCINNCPGDVGAFGEESELASEIAQAEKLEPNFGETPKVRVYYKGLPKRFIAGCVYNPATKDVVIGATCTVSGAAGNTSAATDDFGDFWFEGLSKGTFTLTISGDGKTKTITGDTTEKDVALGDIALT